METVETVQAGSSIRLRGEIIVEATDGGMILRDRQGKLWPLQPDQIKAPLQWCVSFEALTHKGAALGTLVAQVSPRLLQPSLAGFHQAHVVATLQ